MRGSQQWFLSLAAAGLMALGEAAISSRSLAQEEPGPGQPVAVERIVLRFAAGEFSIFSRLATRKVLPPSDELPAVQIPLAGFWYEVLAADGSLRYRRILEDPIRLVFEGPEPNLPPGTEAVPSRKEAIPSERFIPLLVPLPAEGDLLVLYSSPLELGAQGEPASEVARLELAPVVIP